MRPVAAEPRRLAAATADVAAQPWIDGPLSDGLFILAPPLLATLAAWVCARHFGEHADVPPAAWFVLVVFVDVAHVYGTLFRTYLDREERRRRRRLLVATPLLAWLAGTALYAVDALVFWRVLAYIAALHFVRQQYGFVRVYARAERDLPAFFRRLDAATIYLATLYPLAYWHAHAPRAFAWFVPGDFLSGLSPAVSAALGLVYAVVLAAYAAGQTALLVRDRRLNIPKNLVVAGTALSWYVGIVRFNGDLIFTMTNVVAHGIPYLALVWTLRRKRRPRAAAATRRAASVRAALPPLAGFLLLLTALAYLEEGLWDGLIYRDHTALFPAFDALPVVESAHVLVWLVPLLAVPQMTHYVLDGFIWKLRGAGSRWRQGLGA